jgi:hypothetical protein
MSSKRKRKRVGAAHAGDQKTSSKRIKLGNRVLPSQESCQHPVLSFYYPQVLTLRSYLVARLPPSARLRRKRLLSLPQWRGPSDQEQEQHQHQRASEDEIELSALIHLLDTVLVGYSPDLSIDFEQVIRDFASYSQSSATSTLGSGAVSQSKVGQAL